MKKTREDYWAAREALVSDFNDRCDAIVFNMRADIRLAFLKHRAAIEKIERAEKRRLKKTR